MIRAIYGTKSAVAPSLRRLRGDPAFTSLTILRMYSASTPLSQSDEPETETADPTPKDRNLDPRKLARDYANRRAAYKKEVSKIRVRYAKEIAAQTAKDDAETKAIREATRRAKLERQRLKNIRSARNAMREQEKRLARKAEFEEELRVAQVNRDARNERFRKARQMVVDELEAEAHLWLTTPEEVDAAFGDGLAVSQQLWAHRGGVLGAPVPTEDAEFWRYESHTWDMSKTFRTPRENLLEELEELTYFEANMDDSYWTEERLKDLAVKEEKAKLRAMVREEGRRALLAKQKRMLQDTFGSENDPGAIPKAMPVPKLDVLANYGAMEKEGAKILREDPTKFFVFEEGEGVVGDDGTGEYGGVGVDEGTEAKKAKVGTLGMPVGLRDPLRDPNDGSPYPELIGKLPKPDMRTEREKKRDARQARMYEAAMGKDSNEGQSAAEHVDLEDGAGEDLDYNELSKSYDSDDEVWEEGLDPDRDAEILATPRDRRYTEDDFAWVIEQLEGKVAKLEEQLSYELDSAKQEMRAMAETEATERKLHEGEPTTGDRGGEEGGSAVQTTAGVDDRGRSFIEYDPDELDLNTLGVDVDKMEDVLSTLSKDQMSALQALDDDDVVMTSPQEIEAALGKVPGLSKEQVKSLVDLELSLVENEELKGALLTEDENGKGKDKD